MIWAGYCDGAERAEELAMASADVQLELAAIFERLDRIEGQIDEVEAELRAKAATMTPVDPTPRL